MASLTATMTKYPAVIPIISTALFQPWAPQQGDTGPVLIYYTDHTFSEVAGSICFQGFLVYIPEMAIGGQVGMKRQRNSTQDIYMDLGCRHSLTARGACVWHTHVHAP